LLRQVNASFENEFCRFIESGLYDELLQRGLIVPHEEVDATPYLGRGAWRVLRPDVIDTLSYPYEWCFGQLKDAALATLHIQSLALEKGMCLRDASAFNIQFHHGRPILIDTLSLGRYVPGQPWRAYRQFVSHFLAPLALMAHVDVRLGRLLQLDVDGVPLDLASRLLPAATKLKPGLLMHLHLHAKADRSPKSPGSQPKAEFGRNAMMGLIDSLRGSIEGLHYDPKGTEWADYYENTNYAESSMGAKRRLVGELLDSIRPRPASCWDLGANTGAFSDLAAERGIRTVAWDVDPAAVERNYRRPDRNPLILPLLQDLTAPSPALGWALRERESLAERGPAEVVLALALIHHLTIAHNVPLREVASFLASLTSWLIIEFVPKSDSQVQRMLAFREDHFDDYSIDGFREAFAERFNFEREVPIPGTERTLFLARRKSDAG